MPVLSVIDALLPRRPKVVVPLSGRLVSVLSSVSVLFWLIVKPLEFRGTEQVQDESAARESAADGRAADRGSPCIGVGIGQRQRARVDVGVTREGIGGEQRDGSGRPLWSNRYH